MNSHVDVWLQKVCCARVCFSITMGEALVAQLVEALPEDVIIVKSKAGPGIDGETAGGQEIWTWYAVPVSVTSTWISLENSIWLKYSMSPSSSGVFWQDADPGVAVNVAGALVTMAPGVIVEVELAAVNFAAESKLVRLA